jgi:hypothetical protein
MKQLIAHLIGDYILQIYWMATEGEAWDMFEKANPNVMVIEANLL